MCVCGEGGRYVSGQVVRRGVPGIPQLPTWLLLTERQDSLKEEAHRQTAGQGQRPC